MMITEGQELQRKDKPNVRVLVCEVRGGRVLCTCDDGYQRRFKKHTLLKHYQPVEAGNEGYCQLCGEKMPGLQWVTVDEKPCRACEICVGDFSR